MSIAFGAGTLTVLQNLVLTNVAVTTGSSGVPAQNLQVSSGALIIDGITALVSAQSASFAAAGNTGSGLLIYAYLAAGDTVTGTLAILSAAHPTNTASNIPTAITPIARFSFGTGTNTIGAASIVAWSGGSATKTVARVQNVSINYSTELAQMRGGGDIFPVDTQPFDGKVEGSFEAADTTATHLPIFFGGAYASGGSASGTWSLTGASKPEPISLVFQNVTNGITSTYTIRKAFVSQLTDDFTRTDYMVPSYSFVAQANNFNQVMTVQQ